MFGENDNGLKKFGFYKDKEFILEKQNIERDYRNLIGESLDIKSHVRDGFSAYTSQNRLFPSELLSFSRKIRFSKQEFSADNLVLGIKYFHPSS